MNEIYIVFCFGILNQNGHERNHLVPGGKARRGSEHHPQVGSAAKQTHHCNRVTFRARGVVPLEVRSRSRRYGHSKHCVDWKQPEHLPDELHHWRSQQGGAQCWRWPWPRGLETAARRIRPDVIDEKGCHLRYGAKTRSLRKIKIWPGAWANYWERNDNTKTSQTNKGGLAGYLMMH